MTEVRYKFCCINECALHFSQKITHTKSYCSFVFASIMFKRKGLAPEKRAIIVNIFELLRDIQVNKINLFDSSDGDLKRLVATTAFVSKPTVDKVLREKAISGVSCELTTNSETDKTNELNNEAGPNKNAEESGDLDGDSVTQAKKRKERPT